MISQLALAIVGILFISFPHQNLKAQEPSARNLSKKETAVMPKTKNSLSHAEVAVQFFKDLNKDTMHLVNEFYDQNIQFQDPIHKIQGVDLMRSYYQSLYKNVEAISFHFTQTLEQDDKVLLVWTMKLKTPQLNGGQEFTVDGNSVIVFDKKSGKATYHRDYFDMGEFIYERIPVLQRLIVWIKGRLKT